MHHLIVELMNRKITSFIKWRNIFKCRCCHQHSICWVQWVACTHDLHFARTSHLEKSRSKIKISFMTMYGQGRLIFNCDHVIQCRAERQRYYHHIAKARRNPEKYVSVISDVMDQSKTNIPHWLSKSKVTNHCLLPFTTSNICIKHWPIKCDFKSHEAFFQNIKEITIAFQSYKFYKVFELVVF